MVNAFCGLFSDLVIVTIIAFLAWPVLMTKSHIKKTATLFLFPVVLLTLSFFASHLRYVEHFGMNLRPFHLKSLDATGGGGQVWWVGLKMVLTSWKSALLLLLPLPLSMYLGWRFEETLSAKLPRGKKSIPAIVLFMIVGALFNTSSINMRHGKGIHRDLRYNPLIALDQSIKESRKLKSYPMPTHEERQKVRHLIGGGRQFAQDNHSSEYPLWQNGLPGIPARNAQLESVRAGFRKFVGEMEQKYGQPPNVVIVTTESLRANELRGFLPREPGPTPTIGRYIEKLAAEGIAFTEVIGAGLRTHFGQSAIQCSMYGAEDFTIVAGAPMTYSACLSDIYSTLGYDTWFVYGADNHFDNQGIFYKFHKTRHVVDENDFPKDGAKGGWGYSDHEVYNYTLKALKNVNQPFFVNILTLTNHAPYAVPSDFPESEKNGRLNTRWQAAHYADWAFHDFYRKLAKDHPNTIVVLVADHGRFEGEKIGTGVPPYRKLRQVVRIPWLILAPELPAELRGVRADHVVSQVDVAPTLMSLTNRLDLQHQFMGVDAFTRDTPVYIDWQNELLEIDQEKNVSLVPEEYEFILGAISRYNLLAPPRDEWRSIR